MVNNSFTHMVPVHPLMKSYLAYNADHTEGSMLEHLYRSHLSTAVKHASRGGEDAKTAINLAYVHLSSPAYSEATKHAVLEAFIPSIETHSLTMWVLKNMDRVSATRLLKDNVSVSHRYGAYIAYDLTVEQQNQFVDAMFENGLLFQQSFTRDGVKKYLKFEEMLNRWANTVGWGPVLASKHITVELALSMVNTTLDYNTVPERFRKNILATYEWLRGAMGMTDADGIPFDMFKKATETIYGCALHYPDERKSEFVH